MKNSTLKLLAMLIALTSLTMLADEVNSNGGTKQIVIKRRGASHVEHLSF